MISVQTKMIFARAIENFHYQSSMFNGPKENESHSIFCSDNSEIAAAIGEPLKLGTWSITNASSSV